MAAVEEEGRMPFHVTHKVPAGDGFYVRAKHAQLVERKPEKAIALFRASLEAGDRADSALKDLAIVLKQQNRPHDAILAISTFRARCSESAQDSLDNVLLDLYKSSGRLDDQIALLIRKLRAFQSNQSFNGKRTKTARSQGKKFQVSVEQEVARLLGNLGWAYMQQSNYKDAESVYRQALALEADSNRACNLGVCLIKQGKPEEAIAVLQAVSFCNNKRANSGSYLKSFERAQELMGEASAMLMSNGSVDSSDRSRSGEGVQPRGHCKGASDDRSDTRSDVSLRDGCTDHVSTSKNEGVEKVSERVAAAWVLGCRNGKYDDAGGVTTGDACEERSIQDVEMEGSDSSLQYHAPVIPTVPSLNSSWMSQKQARRRRLPVFQDLTLLGSAAA